MPNWRLNDDTEDEWMDDEEEECWTYDSDFIEDFLDTEDIF